MVETLRKNKLSIQSIEDWKKCYLNTITRVYILLVLYRWTLHLLCVCPSPEEAAIPWQWEGVSLPVNVTEDEVHKGVQAHLV